MISRFAAGISTGWPYTFTTKLETVKCPAAVARELTKIHETCVRGTLSQLAADPALAEVKGEIVIVVGPPLPAAKAQAESADELLAEALTRLSPGEAATEVAQALKLPRKTVYARLLAMKSAS